MEFTVQGGFHAAYVAGLSPALRGLAHTIPISDPAST